MELGLGAKPVAISRDFASGNLRATNAPYDVAIEGRGFLQVTLPDGQTAYTRSGNLHVNQEGTLVTNEGYVLEPSITIPANAVVGDDLARTASSRRRWRARARRSRSAPSQLAAFQNPAGLHAMGSNLFTVTTASGDAITGLPGTEGLGTLQQGFLEESNVSIVEEMVNMILGQRAYEANSKVIRDGRRDAVAGEQPCALTAMRAVARVAPGLAGRRVAGRGRARRGAQTPADVAGGRGRGHRGGARGVRRRRRRHACRQPVLSLTADAPSS